MKSPLPYCACGCGRRVKEYRSRYFSIACIPPATRLASIRKARATYARRQRARSFGDAWVRYASSERTREDFFAVVHDIAERWWKCGYGCSDKKWARRQARKTAAA